MVLQHGIMVCDGLVGSQLVLFGRTLFSSERFQLILTRFTAGLIDCCEYHRHNSVACQTETSPINIHRHLGKSKMPNKTIYHFMRILNARMAANYKRGIGLTRLVLLLTTTGRKSGLPRVTPLQFEEVDDDYYIASARGRKADWFKNIQAHPNIHVQIREREFDAVAEPVIDPIRIADFIELRLKRHPVMIRLIMTLIDGLPLRFTRADLEAFCQDKAMAVLHPITEQDTFS
jgi:deazaflavin-dependent oxidoreductase (nitroreductase family)